MIKFLLAISTMAVLSNVAHAELLPQNALSIELGGLYLTQDNDGNTTTLLPMVDYKVMQKDQLSLLAKLGATAYKDDPTDKTFFVGVLHVNPAYRIQNSSWGIEAILGLQYWDEGKKTASEFGARVNYSPTALSFDYLDQIFVGGSLINTSEKTTSLTVGARKDF